MKYSEISKIIEEAKRCIDNKEFEKAIELVEPIIDYHKFNNPYAFMLKLLAELRGDYRDALKECDSLIETENEQYFYLIIKACIHYDLKEYDKSLKLYDSSLELNSACLATYKGKGNSYYFLKEYSKALECYDKAIELDENNVHPYYNKGLVYADLKEYEKAFEFHDKAISLDENYVSAYNGKGVVYENMKNYYEALEWYDKAIKLDNKFSWAYRNKGDVYYELKDFTRAINHYKKAIELKPDYKDDLEYWIERAEAALEEQKKNEQNQKRSEIAQVIEDIKKLLEYKEEQVCHYTSTFVFKELCKGSKLRFSHAALVNDPTEGKSLYDFLGVESIERKDRAGFIGSFVESHNNDTLPLWRAYGRDGEGVSICLDSKVLIESLNTEIAEKLEKSKTAVTNKISRKLYKIVYVDAYTDENEEEVYNFLIDGEQDESLEAKLKELKTLLEPLIKDKTVKNEEALEPVVEIQYLFKNAIYKGEREVRYYELIFNDSLQIKWDDSVPLPTTYIEVDNDIRNHIQSVTLGPKAKNATTWMALYKTMLAREGNKDVSVTQSKIPYR